MKKILLSAIALFVLAACTKDKTSEPAILQPKTLLVTLENDSRIQLNGNQTVWNTNDRVSVFYYSDANDCWRFDGKTGDKSGNLIRETQGSETVKIDKIVIAYPYNKEYVISPEENRIYTSISATQKYESESYGIGENIMVSSGTDNSFALKSVCGWLKLQLTGYGKVYKIKLKGNNNEQLAGKAFIDYDIPNITLIGDRSGEIGDSEVGGTLVFDDEYITEITLDCGNEGVALDMETATEFYITLVPQTFSKGISIVMDMGNGKILEKSTNNAISVERNHIVPMGTIETSSQKIKDENDFLEFIKATNSNNYYNRFKNAAGEIVLANDIDLTGIEVPQITGLDGAGFVDVFDGQGFALKNLAFVGGSLIKENKGTIKNVTFDGCQFDNSIIGVNAAAATVSGVSMTATCDVEFAAPTGAFDFGFIVGNNAGLVEKCTNSIVYQKDIASTPNKSCNFGGIVGSSTGLVADCSFNGTFEMNILAPTRSQYHTFAGVVGYVNGSADQILVHNCTNEGSVSVKIKNGCYFSVGGVVGSTLTNRNATGNYGIIDSCINNGTVGMIYVDGGSGAYPVCGGVCANIEGYIQNCTNNGNIALECLHATNSWTGVKQGGVAGIVTRGADNCHNYGALSFKGNSSGGTAGARNSGNSGLSVWAGVIAAAGPVTSSNDVVFKNCTNNTEINLTLGTITGTPQFAVGGVFGTLTGSAKNCVNNKNISLATACFVPRVGGVAAATNCNMTDCSNVGNIKVDDTGVYSAGDVNNKRHHVLIGGITGTGCTNGYAFTLTNCSNSGSIELVGGMEESTNPTYIGGVYGGDAYNVVNTVTFTDYTNSGSITAPAFDNVHKGNLKGADNDL